MLFICVGFLGCSEKYDIAKQCLQPKGCSLISLTLNKKDVLTFKENVEKLKRIFNFA